MSNSPPWGSCSGGWDAGRTGGRHRRARGFRTARLTQAAHTLARDLRSGRWPITSGTYHYIAQEIARWDPQAEGDSRPQVALAEAVERLWEHWRRGMTQSGGRESVGSALLVWRRSGSMIAAFAANGAGIPGCRASYMITA